MIHDRRISFYGHGFLNVPIINFKNGKFYMEKLLQISIITPEKEVYSNSGKSIKLPGSLSPFEVLYNHAPIVSSLDKGDIKIVNQNGEEEIFATGKGMVEINNNVVSIIVESID